MAGMAATQLPVSGVSPAAAFVVGSGRSAPDNALNQSALNSYRISAVIDRLYRHVQDIRKCDAYEFVNLCLSLARGIDFAIANNEVPSRSQELPPLINLVCKDTSDPLLHAAIMVLMISVKSACQSGWFSDKHCEELNNLAKEIGSTYGSVSDINTIPSCSHSVISMIMSRFYPKMRMGHVFAFLEIKPGFEAYLTDFQISKSVKPSPGEEIRLFVAQTDNTETSSCLVSPAKANFLLNGKGVEKRTNLSMDTGPQFPTNVTRVLKYGSNLLQAVGEFNVTFMSEMPNLDSGSLQDYEQYATVALDSDSEIIEGPSKISLNCPISLQRIMTPVKGRSCNHIQCFDFDNYVKMNSRVPSWRCPSCHQHVCFTDIRIDRKMVKVLQEVGADVSDIIVSSDGSWNSLMESDDAGEKSVGKKIGMEEDDPAESAGVMDLTQIDDAMDTTDDCGTKDTKNVDLFQFMSQDTTVSPHTANGSDVNQNSSQVSNGSLPGNSMPTNIQSNTQEAGVSAPFSTDLFNFPEVEASDGDLLSILRNQTSLPNALPLRQQQLGNAPIDNEYGGFPSTMPRNMTRTPNAVQALPVPMQNPVPQPSPRHFLPNTLSAASQVSPAAPNISTTLPVQSPSPAVQQSSRNNLNAFIPNRISASLQASPAAPVIVATFRAQSPNPVLQQRSRNGMSCIPAHHTNSRNVSQVPLPPLLHQHRAQRNPFPLAQSQVQTQQNPFPPAQPHQQQDAGLHSPNQMANLRPPRSSMQSSRNFLPPRSHAGSRNIQETRAPSSQQALIAAANRTGDVSISCPAYSGNVNVSTIPSLRDQRGNTGVTSQPVTGTEAFDPNDLNWRPSTRMRGALTGQAYIEALNQYIIQPSQQAQATRPNMTSLPANVMSQFHALVSGGAADGATPAQAEYSSAGPDFVSDPFAESYGIP